MQLPVFQHNPGCDLCPLGDQSRQHNTPICLATRPLHERPPSHTTALLVVGDHPGIHELEQSKPFVGPAGKLLTRLYLQPGGSLWDISQHADVYLTNLIRCGTGGPDVKPPASASRACRSFLAADIDALKQSYKDVVLLSAGSLSAQAIFGCKQSKAFSRQGRASQFGPIAFVTYNPAILLPRRDPAKAHAIAQHLELLVDYLKHGVRWAIDTIPPSLVNPMPPTTPEPYITLDIETFGSIAGRPTQRYMHPLKAMHFDGVKRSDLIVSVTITLPLAGGLRSPAIFYMQDPEHRSNFLDWMRWARQHHVQIRGANLKFDMLWLRAFFPLHAHTLLNRSLQLSDVMIWNFLEDSTRPELSLKALSKLFGIVEYTHTLQNTRFPSVRHPDFQRYNAQDCYAADALITLLQTRIRKVYGPDTPKLSEYCTNWYSNLLWTIIELSEAGSAVDLSLIDNLLAEYTGRRQAAIDAYFTAYGVPLCGPGSRTTAKSLSVECMTMTGGKFSKDLKECKDGTVSLDKANRVLINKRLEEIATESPPDWPGHVTLNKLKLVKDFRDNEKIVSSYLIPFRDLAIDGIVYPDYFPVPSPFKSEDESHGTVQCRLSATEPPTQTVPRPLHRMYTTRFDPGFQIVADESQMELRIAGLLSNDQEFFRAYTLDLDIHRETAIAIFGPDVVDRPDFDLYRHAAKQTNFLMIYLGGPDRLRTTLREKAGYIVTEEQAAALIQRYFQKYHTLYQYLLSEQQKAVKLGRIDAPLMGASRLLGGNKRVLLTTYENTIVNFPVQATAVNILLDAQSGVCQELTSRGFQSKVTLQVHDSLYVEGPAPEYKAVREMLERWMPNPPFYRKLCESLGRYMPLKIDVKTRWRRSNDLLSRA